jgi:hypothetical protein
MESGSSPHATAAAADESTTRRKGCKIIYEGNPQAFVLGRFVFKEGKSSLHSAEGQQSCHIHKAEEPQDPYISNADMARAFLRGPDARKHEDASNRKKPRSR